MDSVKTVHLLISTALDRAKDIVQIAFFALTGWVAIATLNRAQRTVLQTNRAEVFKEQIKLFTRLLRLLGGTRNELHDKLKLDRYITLNVAYMLDCYTMFIDQKSIDPAGRPYSKNVVFRFVFPPDKWRAQYASDEDIDWFFADTPEMHRGTKEDGKAAIEAAIKKTKWSRYYPVNVYYPLEAHRITSELRDIADSPIVPSELRRLLEELLETITKYEFEILKAIAEVSQELPSACPTRSLLASAELFYWHNKVNHLCPFEDWTRDLRHYLRRYFEPDKVQPRKRFWHYLGF